MDAALRKGEAFPQVRRRSRRLLPAQLSAIWTGLGLAPAQAVPRDGPTVKLGNYQDKGRDSACVKPILRLYLVGLPARRGLPEQPRPRTGPVAQVARAHP